MLDAWQQAHLCQLMWCERWRSEGWDLAMSPERAMVYVPSAHSIREVQGEEASPILTGAKPHHIAARTLIAEFHPDYLLTLFGRLNDL